MESCGIFSKESSCENLGIFINNGPDGGTAAAGRPTAKVATGSLSFSAGLAECETERMLLLSSDAFYDWAVM